MVDESFDIFEYANTHDVARRFEPLTGAELRTLHEYDRLCQEMGESTFFNGSVELQVSNSISLDHAGRDALRSLAMTFRQLWAQSDGTRFQKVLAHVREHVRADDAELTEAVDELGRRYRTVRKETLMKHVVEGNEMGTPLKEFSAEQVVDDWLNGGNFHSDRHEVIDRVRGWSPEAYEWSLIKALTEAAGVMWELQVLVKYALAASDSASAAV